MNIGCGTSPTPGYLNFAGSSAVWLARIPFRLSFAKRLGILSDEDLRYIEAFKSSATRFADATRRIPLPDASVEALYSSHMLEHLPPDRVPSSRHGFDDPIVQPEGVTRIADPGSLDLLERCTESVFVEALR